MEFHLPEAHAFADDSQLYVSFQPNENANESAAITAMQNCIDDVKKWMFANKLKLNDGKTEFLLIGTRQQLAKVLKFAKQHFFIYTTLGRYGNSSTSIILIH